MWVQLKCSINCRLEWQKSLRLPYSVQTALWASNWHTLHFPLNLHAIYVIIAEICLDGICEVNYRMFIQLQRQTRWLQKSFPQRYFRTASASINYSIYGAFTLTVTDTVQYEHHRILYNPFLLVFFIGLCQYELNIQYELILCREFHV